MIDQLVHDAGTMFIWLLLFNAIFLIIMFVGAIRKPKHYKLKRGL